MGGKIQTPHRYPTKLSYFVSNHSVPIVVIFILILIPFAIAQNKTSVYYTLFDSLPQDLTGIVGTNKLGEDFGMTTSHFILVHDDLTATQVSDLCDELKDVDGITQVVSLDSITGPGFDTELLPDSVMEILQSGGYKLILANSSYKTGTDAINSQLERPDRGGRRGLQERQRLVDHGGAGHHRHLLQEHLHPGAAGCQHRSRYCHQHGHPVLYRYAAALHQWMVPESANAKKSEKE